MPLGNAKRARVPCGLCKPWLRATTLGMAQRWVLVALAALAGLLLVWTIATWPSAPEDLASTTRDEAAGDLEDYQVPAPEPTTGSAVLPPTAAKPEPPSEPEPEAAEQPPAPAAAESAEARSRRTFRA